MKLSEHFTLDEFCRSATAELHNIKNNPGTLEVQNMLWGCVNVLEPLRNILDEPIIITSGYRCEKLNSLVGGVKGSFHTKGCAADLMVKSAQHAKRIFAALQEKHIVKNVDSCLFEHAGNAQWLHVQWAPYINPNRSIFNFNYHVSKK